ncbi:MAG: amidohydrolase family protein [Acidimicrobiales bacterium]
MGTPFSRDRRRLLLALGFGAVNAAALGALPRQDRSPDGAGAAATNGGNERTGPPQPPPALQGATDEPAAGHRYDVVITGGRVMDPESGFDDVANVGIDGETVTAISREPLEGARSVDADGLVVAPGFIDILSYEPGAAGIWYKIADGVTTNLGMHGIDARASEFFARFANEGSPCHYGGAYDNPFMRSHPDGLDIQPGEAATPAEVDAMVEDCRRQLADGWIGVDLEPEYTPGVEYEEMRRLAEVAAEAGVPVFVHGRYSDNEQPGTNADTLNEILQLARDTGVAVHVEHIVSTGGTFTMDESLDTLQRAIDDEAIDVSACMYPYTYWATYLGSARFADGWQDRFHISYDDLMVAGTGERLTASTFRARQRENLLVAAFAIPENDVRTCIRSPLVMIGSDAILDPSFNNHPRATGCFTRVLGRYARTEGVLSLMDALAKMTIMPARRLEGAAPVLRRKGRLQRGADADVVVFDPENVRDTSTVENPDSYASGVEWVFVLGQTVQTPDGQDHDIRPGRPITLGAA